MNSNEATALAVKCPTCKALPGQWCATRLARGYHLTRADRGVRAERRAEQRGLPISPDCQPDEAPL